MKILSEDIIESVRRLQEIRAERARLEREGDQLRDLILNVLGEDDKGLTASGAPAVHVQVQNRRGVNRDRLEAMWPEIFEQVVEETEVRVLKITL